MAKKDEWTTCGECESEFRVISDNHEHAAFCPFCGYELDDQTEDEWDDTNEWEN
jgi:uncharacterized paraquat-inducible protein A